MGRQGADKRNKERARQQKQRDKAVIRVDRQTDDTVPAGADGVGVREDIVHSRGEVVTPWGEIVALGGGDARDVDGRPLPGNGRSPKGALT